MENSTSLYGFEVREPDQRRTERNGTHDIKQLWQRSHEILGLALQGIKNTEIAKILSISPVTVSNTLNSSLGREKLAEMRGERDEHYVKVSEHVKQLTIKALETYHKLFDTPGVDPELKKKTADTVTLDIAGMRAPTKVDTRTLHAHASLDEIMEFRRRGIEAARESGMIIELEPEEVRQNA
jgi:DNA-binding CsgD family transcriptional regulator